MLKLEKRKFYATKRSTNLNRKFFLLEVYFSFKLKKNSIDNRKFNFLTRICKI